jgi:hypothetical protein
MKLVKQKGMSDEYTANIKIVNNLPLFKQIRNDFEPKIS